MTGVFPLTLALSPNTKHVLGERDKIVETLTQGGTSGSCRWCRPGLSSDAPLGLYYEEAASCRSQMSNLQIPAFAGMTILGQLALDLKSPSFRPSEARAGIQPDRGQTTSALPGSLRLARYDADLVGIGEGNHLFAINQQRLVCIDGQCRRIGFHH